MVGEKIKKILKAKGISQADLGRLINKERSNVTNLLRSDNMGVQTLRQIAEALDVPVSSFFDDNPPQQLNEPLEPYHKKTNKEKELSSENEKLKNELLDMQKQVIELMKKQAK